jgi:hypothetical protein
MYETLSLLEAREESASGPVEATDETLSVSVVDATLSGPGEATEEDSGSGEDDTGESDLDPQEPRESDASLAIAPPATQSIAPPSPPPSSSVLFFYSVQEVRVPALYINSQVRWVTNLLSKYRINLELSVGNGAPKIFKLINKTKDKTTEKTIDKTLLFTSCGKPDEDVNPHLSNSYLY